MTSCLAWVLLLLLQLGPTAGAGEPRWAGRWVTSFGPMRLDQSGDEVSGLYFMAGAECSLQGRADGTRLEFHYIEPTATGEAWFQLAADGDAFEGQWREDGSERWSAWAGKRLAGVDRLSGISLAEPSELQIEGLALLGRVWGFLKYHHPKVTGGELDWDAALFEVMPVLLAATSLPEQQAALAGWAEARLGAAPPCKPCARLPEDLCLMADIEWIGDRSLLGEALASFLSHTWRNRHADEDQHYVAQSSGVGNPRFDNESAEPEVALPDAGQRLLALFRFWSIIEYWFPYRDLLDDEWPDVLREFVPRVVAAADRVAYAQVLVELIGRAHDSHANLWTAPWAHPPMGPCNLPVLVRFVEDRPTVVGYSHPEWGPASGLQVGDVLLALDGQPLQESITRWAPGYPASNEAARRRDMARTLGCGPCGEVRLSIERAGLVQELAVRRARLSELNVFGDGIHSRSGDTFQWLSDEVAYLSLATIRKEDVSGYVEQARRARGLVIDIRNYPGSFVVFELGRHLVAEPTPFVKFSAGSLSNPGCFSMVTMLELEPREPRIEGQIAILVDESTQSSAEYSTMAFRTAPGALVIGSTTAGADGNVSEIPLPGGHRAMISGLGVFTPTGQPTQRVGIVPDVVVRPTRSGIMEGRDEVLEEAVRRILPDLDEPTLRAMTRRP